MADTRFSSWKEGDLLKEAMKTILNRALNGKKRYTFCEKTSLNTPGVSNTGQTSTAHNPLDSVSSVGECLQEGPCSPARISQTRFFPFLGIKCLSQMVISSNLSKGTNSRGPILVYFWALQEISDDKLWTVNSSPIGQ